MNESVEMDTEALHQLTRVIPMHKMYIKVKIGHRTEGFFMRLSPFLERKSSFPGFKIPEGKSRANQKRVMSSLKDDLSFDTLIKGHIFFSQCPKFNPSLKNS